MPERKGRLCVGYPNVGSYSAFLWAALKILRSRWFSNLGPVVQRFEAAVAAFLGVEHFVSTCNGTVALEIATKALGVAGEVLMPSWTFIATPHAVEWVGARPVFVDVDPASHTLDVDDLLSRATWETGGILGVHLWGHPCDVEALEWAGRRLGVPVYYDAAHAFGVECGGEMVGNFGACEVFSFHATKFFNTFEGGGIATNDPILAHRLRLISNFGFARRDSVLIAGTNGKMTEIAAAMGLVNLGRIEKVVSVNRSRYVRYRECLAGIPGVRLASDFPLDARHNYQYVVVEVPPGLRADVLLALSAAGVDARRYFYPGCHRMDCYAPPERPLPVTERLAESVVVLPTGPHVSLADVEMICETIRATCRYSLTGKTHVW